MTHTFLGALLDVYPLNGFKLIFLKRVGGLNLLHVLLIDFLYKNDLREYFVSLLSLLLLFLAVN